MYDNAHVRSTEALIDLADAFGRFASEGDRLTCDLQREIGDRYIALQEKEDAARDQVEACISGLESADEDDSGYWSDELDDARRRLRFIRHRRRQVDEEYSRFRALAAGALRTISQAPRARAFLLEKIEELRTYHSIVLDVGDRPAPQAALAAQPRVPVPVDGGTSLSQFKLPAGFAWVRLADIDLEGGLEAVEGPSDFKKVSHEQMLDGFEKLRRTVLPGMENVGRPSSSIFQSHDAASRASYDEGVQRVYDAFFGSQDFIYLERGREQDRFDIMNGRHRIMVARDLGWEAIPARVKDMRG